MDVSTLGHPIIGFSSSVRRSIVVHRSSICFIPSLNNGRVNYSFFKPLMWVEVGHLLIYPLYGCSTSSDLLPVLFTFPCVFLTWRGVPLLGSPYFSTSLRCPHSAWNDSRYLKWDFGCRNWYSPPSSNSRKCIVEDLCISKSGDYLWKLFILMLKQGVRISSPREFSYTTSLSIAKTTIHVLGRVQFRWWVSET